MRVGELTLYRRRPYLNNLCGRPPVLAAEAHDVRVQGGLGGRVRRDRDGGYSSKQATGKHQGGRISLPLEVRKELDGQVDQPAEVGAHLLVESIQIDLLGS